MSLLNVKTTDSANMWKEFDVIYFGSNPMLGLPSGLDITFKDEESNSVVVFFSLINFFVAMSHITYIICAMFVNL